MTCPHCHADTVTVLGANSEGWSFVCDVCDARWVVRDEALVA